MNRIAISTIRPEHAPQLRRLQLICFPAVPPDDLFSEAELVEMSAVFPEGAFVALDGERVIGLGCGIFVDFDFERPAHTLHGMLDRGHDPDGDYYYGTDVSVHPDYRRRGIGRRLYERRKAFVARCNRRGIIAGGMIPGYRRYRATLDVETYVARVIAGELHDPTLSMQLRNGFEVRGILHNYLTNEDSGGHATLIFWPNPAYVPAADRVTGAGRRTR